MDNDHYEALGSLAKLRQGALLLSMANKFFCDPPLLEKVGREMDRTLQTLPEQIKSLKSRFPGKWEKEPETGHLVSDLHKTVKQLRNPEPDTRAKCGDGDLGRELELGIGNLTAAVHVIVGKVEGRFPAHQSRKASSMVVYRLTSLISSLLRKLIPALILLAVVASLAFGYLFWSMDRKQVVVDRIATLEAQLLSYQKNIGEIDREKERVSQRIEALKRDELPRAEKIEFMDLGLELHKIEERRVKVEVDIDFIENEMQDLRAKLKEIEGKSFMARLLRF
ncbi:MAG: hypothetical protein CVU57_27115 [Deltaproteobacteria bacterium HGW-Deltaproteobacteria-15]|nr:MAG: hypothetical protein CVU57_27115 [Deltaproteobacteria bacterium HGW-Deltaproteobacteria-15]